jgi:AbrB family looped-hinge helix DNA binding protein
VLCQTNLFGLGASQSLRCQVLPRHPTRKVRLDQTQWSRWIGCSSPGGPHLRLDNPRVRYYLTYMKTTVSSKGQIVLPAEIRAEDRIRPGQQFSIERLEPGEYLLKKVTVPDTSGLVDWLLACPEKGWFQPVTSESTDAISTGPL